MYAQKSTTINRTLRYILLTNHRDRVRICNSSYLSMYESTKKGSEAMSQILNSETLLNADLA